MKLPARVWPIALVLALVGFVALVWGLDRAFALSSSATPSWVAGLIVLVPALICLIYFYRLDIHEPEPTHLVFGVFLLGALVAAPLASWVCDELFDVHSWVSLTRFGAAGLAGSFLVVATTQELVKYAVVRYSIYLSPEFDEPADGIVYSTVAGVGFATALNFHRLTSGGALDLPAATIDVVTTTLAHAGFSGVMGYALGLARLGLAPRGRTLAAGFVAAVALNGGYSLVEETVTRRGLDYRPWWGLVASAVFTLAIAAMLSVLMKRHLDRSPHQPGASPPAHLPANLPPSPLGLWDVAIGQGDFAPLLIAAALLAAGAVARRSFAERTTHLDDGMVHLDYPRGWVTSRGNATGTAQLSITDLFGAGQLKPHIALVAERLPPGLAQEDASSALDYVQLNQATRLALYHVIAQRELKLGALSARRIDYAYAVDPAMGIDVSDVPVVVRASDLVFSTGGKVYAVNVAAPLVEWEAHSERYRGIIDSVKVTP